MSYTAYKGQDMQLDASSTVPEILSELGRRLRRYRLQQNRELEEVARTAGVGLRTAARAEAGQNPTLATLIKLLRALGRLDTLDAFLPPALPSPIEMAKLAGRVRERAGTPRFRRDQSDG
jgi:transcriptional regulator with XRE-family HTH domain